MRGSKKTIAYASAVAYWLRVLDAIPTISTVRSSTSLGALPSGWLLVCDMADSILSGAERTLLRELEARGVRFLVVGMSSALLQGARGSTEDIDLWFEDTSDIRIAEAVRAAGGIWISGSFGMGPPRIGGDALSERFDVVVHMDGLEPFAKEYEAVRFESVEGVRLPLLPLRRILQSKKAAGRPKDLLAVIAIEDALVIIEHSKEQ